MAADKTVLDVDQEITRIENAVIESYEAIHDVEVSLSKVYDTIASMGGTVPVNKTIENLNQAIATVSGTGDSKENYHWWSPRMLSNTTASSPLLMLPSLQIKSATPSVSEQTVTPDTGYDGLSKVTLKAAALQEKIVTPSEVSQTTMPDDTYYGLSKVITNPIPSVYKDTSDATATATDIISGKTAYVNGVKVTGTATMASDPKLQTKTISPSTSSQTVTPDTGYDGLSKVTVSAATLQTKTATPSTSSQSITPDSGYYGLNKVTVNALSLQSKSATPSTSSQTITPGSGYQGLSQVTVSAIPSKYKDTSDATATAEDILEGKTAYVNGNLITGTGSASLGNLETIKLTIQNASSYKLLLYSYSSLQASSAAQLQAGTTFEFTFFKGCWVMIVNSGLTGIPYGTRTSGTIQTLNFGTLDINSAYPSPLGNTSQRIGSGGIGMIYATEDSSVMISFS